jgi:hypothetical protein
MSSNEEDANEPQKRFVTVKCSKVPTVPRKVTVECSKVPTVPQTVEFIMETVPTVDLAPEMRKANAMLAEKPARARLECSACGATANAACDCGAPYVPSTAEKRELVAEALKKNPKKSNRQVAQAVGVAHKTIAAVRRGLESTGEIPQLEKTTGKDGRDRPAGKPKVTLPRSTAAQISDPGTDADRTAYLLRVDQAIRLAAYSGPVTEEIVAAARQVAAAWTELATDLANRKLH